MIIILDANIVVGALIGIQVPKTVVALHRRGIPLALCRSQANEAIAVMVRKFGLAPEQAAMAVRRFAAALRILEPEEYAERESSARERLHERAQPDWPVLAAAMATDGAIWSNDRDFFGVGVPVWSTRNAPFASTGS